MKPGWQMLIPAVALLSGCGEALIMGDPAVEVTAVGETEPVGTANQDAADDPAIWRNPADPVQSLIVATDKKAGLYVYGLDGRKRSFLAAGLLNNVDLITFDDGRVLVAASDRTDLVQAHILLTWLDPQSARLSEIGRFPVGAGEAYGLCMQQSVESGGVRVFNPLKQGQVYLTTFSPEGQGWNATSSLLGTLASQPEGCVHDMRTGLLYVGEEAEGIWAFDLETGSRDLVAPVDNHTLVADVEGLALMPEGDNGGYLVASSQGDNAYALFRLPGMEPAGRFRIAKGTFGATEETDGIEVKAGSFGPQFPDGLFVAQDGENEPYAQNFKLVSWADIMEAVTK